MEISIWEVTLGFRGFQEPILLFYECSSHLFSKPRWFTVWAQRVPLPLYWTGWRATECLRLCLQFGKGEILSLNCLPQGAAPMWISVYKSWMEIIQTPAIPLLCNTRKGRITQLNGLAPVLAQTKGKTTPQNTYLLTEFTVRGSGDDWCRGWPQKKIRCIQFEVLLYKLFTLVQTGGRNTESCW